jgi:hypothetical protein
MLRSVHPLGVVPHEVRNGEGVGTEPGEGTGVERPISITDI